MLRPPPQIGIVIACAELDQPRAALEVTSFILERIGHRVGCGVEENAVRVVVVGVDLVAIESLLDELLPFPPESNNSEDIQGQSNKKRIATIR